MRAMRFIIVFIGIVIKGCMESPAIKTTLILLASIVALIFIPYWIGLLVVGIFQIPAWPSGFLCIIVVGLIVAIAVGAYTLVYEAVKGSMRRK